MKRKINIMRQISALSLGIMLAAQSFTALADTKITKGDVNGDGGINVTDIAVTASHIKGIKPLAEDEAEKADVNSDGNINVTDVAMIAAHIKGIKALPETNSKSENSSGTDSKPESSSKTDSRPDSSSETENNEPVYELEDLSGDEILGGARGKIVSFSGKKGEYKVIDAVTGKIERTIKCEEYLSFAGIKKDGTLIMLNTEENNCEEICLFAADKDEPESIKTSFKDLKPLFDEKTDTVYLKSRDTIYKLTDDGKLEEVLNCGDYDDLVGTDVSRMISGLLKDDGKFKGFPKLRTISVSDDKTLWETLSYNGSIAYTKNMAVAYDSISDEDNTVSELRCFDIRTGEKKGIYETSGSVTNIFASDKTDNCILRKSVKSYKDFEDHVTVFNAATGKATYVDIGVKDIVVCNAMCIDENTWAVSVASPTLMSQEMPAPDFTDEWMVGSYAGGGLDESVTRTFIIRTDKQKFNKLDEGQDIEKIKDKLLKHCGEALKAQREKADKLEEKYGVTILIGDEVLNIDCGDTVSSTETNMSDRYPSELDKDLDDLDRWMSAYPEGFFEKFRSPENPKGYILALVDDFSMNQPKEAKEDGPIILGKTEAITYTVSGYICVSITRDSVENDLNSVMDHETWHAVESLVQFEYPLDKDAWDELNPKGFSYHCGDPLESAMMNNDHLLDSYGNDNNYDAYFISEYSGTNQFEDRATIIETLEPSYSSNASFLEDLSNCPHLKAKLDFMGEWSKQYFGYVYWDEMRKTEAFSISEDGSDNRPAHILKNSSDSELSGGANGKLVVFKNDSDEDGIVQSLEYRVIDAETENVEHTFTSEEYLMFAGVKKDGTVIMWNSTGDNGVRLYFITPDKDEPVIKETGIKYSEVLFDEENDTIYLRNDNVLYKMTEEGDLAETAACSEPERFVDADFSHLLISVRKRKEQEENKDDPNLRVISLTDGSTLFDTFTNHNHINFTKNNVMLYSNTDDMSTSIISSFDITNGRENTVFDPDMMIAWIYSSYKTDNCFLVNAKQSNLLTVFDSATGESAYIDLGIRNVGIDKAVCLDENTWAVEVRFQSFGDYGTIERKTVIINTDKLDRAEFEAIPDYA